MRRFLPVIVALVAGVVIGALFSPLRFHFILSPAGSVVYRCNRVTGRVDVGFPGNGGWKTIGERVTWLSDSELQQQLKDEPKK